MVGDRPRRVPGSTVNMGSYTHGIGEKFGMYLALGIPVAAYNQNIKNESDARCRHAQPRQHLVELSGGNAASGTAVVQFGVMAA